MQDEHPAHKSSPQEELALTYRQEADTSPNPDLDPPNHLGEQRSEFENSAVRAIPVRAGGLYPGSDIRLIDPGLDTPERLRVHIAQFAREIVDEVGLGDRVVESHDGIGFMCVPTDGSEGKRSWTPASRGILALRHTLSAPNNPARPAARIDTIHLVRDLGPLLQGWVSADSLAGVRLSDSGLVKLFRLIRLGRRLLEPEGGGGGK